MKNIIYWLVLAFYAGFLLKLLWGQLREVWAMAEAQQNFEETDDFPWHHQPWWGSE